jgi:multidrug efflux pump subunit AcrA (membrane-fusion protein)
VNPVVDPATRQVRIIASLPNVDHTLAVGSFAQGRVSAQTQEGIVVPESAVDFREQTPAVLKLKGGKAQRNEVKLGMRDTDAETVSITNGVQVGDTLLVGAAQGITPGTPVRVQAAPADRATP